MDEDRVWFVLARRLRVDSRATHHRSDRVRLALGSLIVAATSLVSLTSTPAGAVNSSWAHAPAALRLAVQQQAHLAATVATPDPAQTSGDGFGYTVALSGTNAVVGAPNTASSAGAVYFYSLSGGNWNLVSTVSDPAGAVGDSFGVAVAISGTNAIIGASGNSSNQGAVYFYSLSANVWSLSQAAVTDPLGNNGDLFGSAVSISGGTALVGASGVLGNEGAAYFFTQGGGAWTVTSSVADPGAAGGDVFGSAVSVSGTNAVIGASGAANYSGTVYFYTGSAGTWTQLGQPVVDPSGVAYDYFATSVAMSGTNVVIGALSTAVGYGAVYFYALTGGVWTPGTIISDPNANSGDSFGTSVAMSGFSAVVGATGVSSTAGTTYFYGLSGNAWSATTVTNPPSQTGDLVGSAVAVDGSAALIGASGAAQGAGAVYFYGTPSTQGPLTITNTTTTGTAGTAIRLLSSGGSGTLAVVYTTTSRGCSIAGSLLNASGQYTCLVTATNPANGNYGAVSSPPVSFSFTLATQAAIAVANTATSALVGGSITLVGTGGSGSPTFTFSVTGTGCSLSGAVLTDTKAGVCLVTATAPAHGIYGAVTSSPVSFTFSLASQNPLTITNTITTNLMGTSVTLTSSGGSGLLAVTYTVQGQGCSISGNILYGATGDLCYVTATNPASLNYSAITSPTVPFTFALTNQDALTITNTVLTAPAGTPVTLNASGGSGTINIVFTVIGPGCSITRGVLNGIGANLCTVTATNPANGIFATVQSAPVNFSFTLKPQAPVLVTNTITTGPAGTPITLGASGGSGLSNYTFSVTGTGCVLADGALSASGADTCLVTASNPANGIYAPATSSPVTFTFSLVAQQSVYITNVITNGLAGTQIMVTATGGSGTLAPTFTVTGTNCYVSGAVLTATTAATCVVTAVNPINGIYAAVTSSPLTFEFLLGAQRTISITTVKRTVHLGTKISLAYSGGTGYGQVSFAISGAYQNFAGCSITGNLLKSRRTGSCYVVVLKSGSGFYAATTSVPVRFYFV